MSLEKKYCPECEEETMIPKPGDDMFFYCPICGVESVCLGRLGEDISADQVIDILEGMTKGFPIVSDKEGTA